MSAQDKYSLQERGRFKAWWDAARPLDGSAFPYEIAWAAWQAALSAQFSPGETLPPEMRLGSPDYLDYLDAEPSPGGQGEVWDISELVRTDLDRQSCPDAYMRIAMESVVKHLVARQPVGGEKNPDHLRDLADIIDPERQANTIRKVVDGWSGWATQSPGKMPKLYGAREIAEVNHNPDQGQRLIFLSEQPVNVGALADAARAAIPFVAYAFSQGVIGAEESGRAIESALESIPPVGEAVPAEFGLGQFRYSVKRSKSCLENHMQGDPAVISREISECDRLLDLIDSHSGVSRD